MIMFIVRVWCLFILPTLVYAYIDPGTGEMVIQSVIAFLISTLFLVRHPKQALLLVKERLQRKNKNAP
jgi:hypothetical protein